MEQITTETKSLAGKSALVTGSTSGIGKAMAEALAERGCNVVINGMGDPGEIENFRQSLVENHGVQAIYDPADMSRPEQIEQMMAHAKDAFDGPDILINNAGIQFVSPIEDFPPEKWDAIIAINLSAAFHTIRHAVPVMKNKGWGRIINLASAHATVASPFKSAYVAAKHGIAGLTKVVALETAEFGITCNAICPSYVWTPLVEGQLADTAKARGITEEQVKRDVMLARQATKDFVTTDQIAGLATFLCSAAAVNMTGSILPIDGGWTAS